MLTKPNELSASLSSPSHHLRDITGDSDDGNFDRFWGQISTALDYVDLDIRRIKFQDDGKLYMGVVNKEGGETAKLATRLTPEQIALFRLVLDDILKDDDSAENGINVMDALNSTQLMQTQAAAASTQGEGGSTQGGGVLTQAQTQSVNKMTKVEKEATLKELCNDGWLARDTEGGGRLKLGVRSFLELREFLLDQAPDGARGRWEQML